MAIVATGVNLTRKISTEANIHLLASLSLCAEEEELPFAEIFGLEHFDSNMISESSSIFAN